MKSSPNGKGDSFGPDGTAFRKTDASPQNAKGGQQQDASGQSGSNTSKDRPGPGGTGDAAANSNDQQSNNPNAKNSPEDFNKLFRPGTTGPTGSSGQGAANTGAQGPQQPGGRNSDPSQKTDPAERAAAERLERAIQRIQANRDSRMNKPLKVSRGDPANLENGRDW